MTSGRGNPGACVHVGKIRLARETSTLLSLTRKAQSPLTQRVIFDQLHIKRGNNEHCSGPRTEHWRPKGYTPGARYTACAPSDDYKEQRTKIFESGKIYSEKQCPPGPILLPGPKFLADHNFRDKPRLACNCNVVLSVLAPAQASGISRHRFGQG